MCATYAKIGLFLMLTGVNQMTDYEKLEWLHFAIQEAINGNIEELTNALDIVEQLREPYLLEGATQ